MPLENNCLTVAAFILSLAFHALFMPLLPHPSIQPENLERHQTSKKDTSLKLLN